MGTYPSFHNFFLIWCLTAKNISNYGKGRERVKGNIVINLGFENGKNWDHGKIAKSQRRKSFFRPSRPTFSPLSFKEGMPRFRKLNPMVWAASFIFHFNPFFFFSTFPFFDSNIFYSAPWFRIVHTKKISRQAKKHLCPCQFGMHLGW